MREFQCKVNNPVSGENPSPTPQQLWPKLLAIRGELAVFLSGIWLAVILLVTGCTPAVELTPTITPTLPSLSTLAPTETKTATPALEAANPPSATESPTSTAGVATMTPAAPTATMASVVETMPSATPEAVPSAPATQPPLAATSQATATATANSQPTMAAGLTPSATAESETATAPAQEVTPSPSPTAQTAPTAIQTGGAGAANDLSAVTTCSESYPQVGSAMLNWSTASPPGDEQRIDLTRQKNGFELGDFEIYTGLAPDQTSFVVDNLQGQANNYWRVMTLHDSGWVASETAVFVGPTCVADLQPRDP